MVNWKKWFLEEDEDEIYKAEEGRRDKKEKRVASPKESEFDIEEFIECNDSYYYSAHTRAHYYDEPEPRYHRNEYSEFGEEFWEAVDNMMEK